MALSNFNNGSYNKWLTSLKEKVKTSQLRSLLSVNTELLSLYWELGAELDEKILQTLGQGDCQYTFARSTCRVSRGEGIFEDKSI